MIISTSGKRKIAACLAVRPESTEPESTAPVSTAPVSTAPEMDGAQFIRLLELIGPQVGAELVIQLLADLQTARQALVQAFDPPDWASLRAHSHVLTALAGTVGAKRLQQLSEQMNTLAQTGTDLAGLRPVHCDMMDSLDRLIGFLGVCGGRGP